MSEDILIWLTGQLVVGAAIWGGIRTDIKNIHKRIDQTNESANHAHVRIDNILSSRK
jgi:hypothetical protein